MNPDRFPPGVTLGGPNGHTLRIHLPILLAYLGIANNAAHRNEIIGLALDAIDALAGTVTVSLAFEDTEEGSAEA